MSEPHRTASVHLSTLSARAMRDAATRVGHGQGMDLDVTAIEHWLREAPGDAVLFNWDLDWNGVGRSSDDAPDLRGLYAVLGAAARAQRVLFPSRWLPVRLSMEGDAIDASPPARVLAFARSDTALQRLFAEATPALEGRGLARPDEPVVLLGVEGDVLAADASSDATELRRRAEHWIHRLGADRVALAVPPNAPPGHPLRELAAHRALPTMIVGSRQPRGLCSASTPMLWTDFQLDVEHRLPDEVHVPGLRDLLHRGALLRERTLYDRLPDDWRARLDAELRALYAWHVSPLLRRTSAMIQTLDSVRDVEIEAPFRDLHSVAGYLLGLSDRRPVEALFALVDPVESARSLAIALQSFDRRLHARIEESAWSGLHARLATWSEGGLLAQCGSSDGRDREFCFSGTPLVQRVPVRRGADGIARLELDVEDRRALGWFRIECRIVTDSSLSARPAIPVSGQEAAPVVEFGFDARQLDLGLADEDVPYQENTA